MQNESLQSKNKNMSKDLQEKSRIIESQESKIKQIENELRKQKSENESKTNKRPPKQKQVTKAED